jgi:uncharacterized paraquat-inducible protein A
MNLFFIRWFALALLYTLAAPVYLVKWLIGTHKALQRFEQARDGILRCRHCGNVNSLNVLATCKRCGTTEFGSRLYCTNCRQTTKAFACEFCSASIKVL